MRELPFILYTIFIVYHGFHGFKKYSEPNFLVLLIVYFIIVFLGVIVISSIKKSNFARLFSNNKSISYFFLFLSIFFLIFGIVLFFVDLPSIGTKSIPISDYVIFLILPVSLSNYNFFMFIQNKLHEDKSKNHSP